MEAARPLAPGRYRLRGVAIAAIGAEYPVAGELRLSEVSQAEEELLRERGLQGRASGTGVRGLLSDGPVAGETWSAATGKIKFSLLYNACLPYRYVLDTGGR